MPLKIAVLATGILVTVAAACSDLWWMVLSMVAAVVMAASIPTRHWLLLTVLLAPLDLYRVPVASVVSLSPYRIAIIMAALSLLLHPRCWSSLRPDRTFAGLYLPFVLANIVWAATASPEGQGAGLVLNVASGVVLVFMLHTTLREGPHVALSARVLALSSLWVVVSFVYTYYLFSVRHELVNDIPFRDLIPLQLASAGHLQTKPDAGGFPRLALPYTSPPHTAVFLALVAVVLSTAVVVKARRHMPGSGLWRLLFLAVVGVMLLATGSRSGWIAALAGIAAVMGLTSRWRPRRVLLLAAVTTFMLVVVILSFAWVSPAGADLLLRDRLALDRSILGHVDTRLEAVTVWVENARSFLVGVGFGNYSLFGSGLHSHSAYTTILAERGIIGSALFWWFYFGLAFILWRRAVSGLRAGEPPGPVFSRVALLGCMVVILVGSLLYEFLFENYVWITLGLASAASRRSVALEGCRR